MNDITALSPITPEMLASLKLSALNLAEGEMMSFEPAVFRALVEALEKAQRQNGYLREQSAEWERKAISNFQECAKMSERIYLLESRTVTVKSLLPKRKTADDYIDDTFDPSDLAAVHNACRLECEVKLKNALDAAGIQVIEGEGQ